MRQGLGPRGARRAGRSPRVCVGLTWLGTHTYTQGDRLGLRPLQGTVDFGTELVPPTPWASTPHGQSSAQPALPVPTSQPLRDLTPLLVLGCLIAWVLA